MTTHIRLYTLIGSICVGMIALSAWFIYTTKTPAPQVVPTPVDTATTTPPIKETSTKRNIGTSVEGRSIEAYTFGTGEREVLFVGGIHGGYEWNSTLLAYEFIEYLSSTTEAVPQSIRVTIIPTLNPDGLYTVTGKDGVFTLEDVQPITDAGKSRFNAHGVDLNRNFDCKWHPKSMWRGHEVSAGTSAFSEPEAEALRTYIATTNPLGVIFWHSQANAVYASECTEGILPLTRALMNAYAKSAGYTAVDIFDAYPVTGDAEGWLASIGIPAITVELSTHETIEWAKNLAGFKSVLSLYTTTP